jgi:Na+-transporting NADH:ubiquinone oxidoreductase subunit D
MSDKAMQVFLKPLLNENPVALQALGICSALAVTTSLRPALLMCVALIFVASCASGVVSAIRHYMPNSIRIILQITIISTLVIIVDQILKAYAWETSKQLSVFVGLIITNCIVLARCEGFAMHNPVGISVLDGLGHGAGYSLVLILVATVREVLGAGTLLDISVLPLVQDGGWYQANGLMLMAPSGFFIIGLLIWLLRSVKQAPSRANNERAGRHLRQGKESA